MTVPLVRERGSAAAFHARPLPEPAAAEVWVFEVDRPAVVLGSRQGEDVLDLAACADGGVEIVRRRSGGGVVLLEPGRIVWFDVIVPAGALSDDVRASMIWLGERVVEALGRLGVGEVAVHRGPMTGSRDICFAGTGPGEVVVDGAKLVGISQRRTRVASRFQCAVHTHWSPAPLLALLREPPSAELPPVAVLPPDVASGLPAALASSLTP